ncbi:hypothetical protein FB451DRAFT_418131 [Mycena latifolia]|nr:hypothetical protein FB451DRAFT_418131 [Mycena latifolia]
MRFRARQWVFIVSAAACNSPGFGQDWVFTMTPTHVNQPFNACCMRLIRITRGGTTNWCVIPFFPIFVFFSGLKRGARASAYHRNVPQIECTQAPLRTPPDAHVRFSSSSIACYGAVGMAIFATQCTRSGTP